VTFLLTAAAIGLLYKENGGLICIVALSAIALFNDLSRLIHS
jgi:hypothetical protein